MSRRGGVVSEFGHGPKQRLHPLAVHGPGAGAGGYAITATHEYCLGWMLFAVLTGNAPFGRPAEPDGGSRAASAVGVSRADSVADVGCGQPAADRFPVFGGSGLPPSNHDMVR